MVSWVAELFSSWWRGEKLEQGSGEHTYGLYSPGEVRRCEREEPKAQGGLGEHWVRETGRNATSGAVAKAGGWAVAIRRSPTIGCAGYGAWEISFVSRAHWRRGSSIWRLTAGSGGAAPAGGVRRRGGGTYGRQQGARGRRVTVGRRRCVGGGTGMRARARWAKDRDELSLHGQRLARTAAPVGRRRVARHGSPFTITGLAAHVGKRVSCGVAGFGRDL